EELVHEVLFHPDVPRQEIRGEGFRELCVLVERTARCRFRQQGDRAVRCRRRRRHTERLSGEASLPEEGLGPKERDHRLFSLTREDRELDLPPLDEEHSVRAITLREDRLALTVVPSDTADARRRQQ